jgi:hypothetical protein
MRNLSQRERSRLAKAGESDRAIKTKMVRFSTIYLLRHAHRRLSLNTFSPGSEKQARRTADNLSFRVCVSDSWCITFCPARFPVSRCMYPFCIITGFFSYRHGLFLQQYNINVVMHALQE